MVRTFSNHAAAGVAAARLEANGIKCWLHADDCGGAYPNLSLASGVRLSVLVSDAAAATALLDSQLSPEEQAALPSSSWAEQLRPKPLEAPRKRIHLGTLILGVVLGVLLCLLYQWMDRQGIKKYRYDRNDDGRADELWIYRDGRLSQFFRDRNFDGIWDEWADYDSHGRTHSRRFDNNFDGKPDVFDTYSNGERVSEQRTRISAAYLM
jgi:hypothetical protein